MLDARFFGSGPSLPLAFGDLDSEATERAEGGISTLDALLATTYSRSQIYLSRQLAQLHPELTMPMFSGYSCYWILFAMEAHFNIIQK